MKYLPSAVLAIKPLLCMMSRTAPNSSNVEADSSLNALFFLSSLSILIRVVIMMPEASTVFAKLSLPALSMGSLSDMTYDCKLCIHNS
jgi:hypothetical protein